MNIVIIILASVGFIVSLYAYLVEVNIQKNSSYKPACDITNKISCSRAFTSKYSKLLGVSNTLLGMMFYGLILITEFFQLGGLIYYTIAGALASVVLAYLLYAKVGSFCLVCTVIYMVNFLLLIASMRG